MSERAACVQSELLRHSARDIAEAGRELGRFDSRPWLTGSLTAPSAVVMTTQDEAVPPYKQRALAEAARAEVFEVPLHHIELVLRADVYNPALLHALAAVRAREGVKAA